MKKNISHIGRIPLKAGLLSAMLLSASYLILPAVTSAQTISAGVYHSLAICNDNTANAWGDNTYGQLGDGTNSTNNFPVPVSSLTGIIAVSGGGGGLSSLALKNDGTVWAWGLNVDGQIGNGTNTDSNIPLQVSSLTGIIAISGGGSHSVALKNDGTVWAWGNNSTGQLGNGSSSNSNVPVLVNGLTGIIAIAGGGGFSLALKNDSTVWAWGNNWYGQLGNGTNTNPGNIPVQVSFLTGIIAIAGGVEHSLALKNEGTVWAWGKNNYGQLGNGTATYCITAPVQVSSLNGIIAIAAGDYHSLALKNDNIVWAWGNNNQGQLGNGTNTESWVPVQVNSLTGITAIAGGVYHSLAVKNDGRVWTWGGVASNSNVIPVQVIGLCQAANAVNNIIEKEAEINVFPNPSSNTVTIKFSSSSKGKLLLTIKDELGQTVYSENKKDFSGDYVNTIYLSKQPKGIYFVEMILGNERRTRKIIIE